MSKPFELYICQKKSHMHSSSWWRYRMAKKLQHFLLFLEITKLCLVCLAKALFTYSPNILRIAELHAIFSTILINLFMFFCCFVTNLVISVFQYQILGSLFDLVPIICKVHVNSSCVCVTASTSPRCKSELYWNIVYQTHERSSGITLKTKVKNDVIFLQI